MLKNRERNLPRRGEKLAVQDLVFESVLSGTDAGAIGKVFAVDGAVGFFFAALADGEIGGVHDGPPVRGWPRRTTWQTQAA